VDAGCAATDEIYTLPNGVFNALPAGRFKIIRCRCEDPVHVVTYTGAAGVAEVEQLAVVRNRQYPRYHRRMGPGGGGAMETVGERAVFEEEPRNDEIRAVVAFDFEKCP